MVFIAYAGVFAYYSYHDELANGGPAGQAQPVSRNAAADQLAAAAISAALIGYTARQFGVPRCDIRLLMVRHYPQTDVSSKNALASLRRC